MRGSGRYGESGSRAHPRGLVQHMSGHRMDHQPVNYHGRSDPMASNKDYGASKAERQWKWERDGSKAPTPMSPHMFQNQGFDDSRSYNQVQKTDVEMGLERHGTRDPLSVSRGEDLNMGYENNALPNNFEDLEKKIFEDITKLSKEQNDAEDAENARHREKINTINVKHQEQLEALRARYANRREEILQKESQAREKQYQQAMMYSYPGSGMGPNGPHGYANEPRGKYDSNQYDSNQYDSYREQAPYLPNNTRDQALEQRGPYPSGRVYDTGSRYY